MACLLGGGGVFGAEPARLHATRPEGDGWVEVSGQIGQGDQRIGLLTSSNLAQWATSVVLHANGAFRYLDPVSARQPRRYYRVRSDLLEPADDWKNQVGHPEDAFKNHTGSFLHWIKFAIRTDDPTRVYYAKHTFPFHVDFVTARLEPFVGIDAPELDRISLFNEGRRLLLGTILYPRLGSAGEYGIQFVSQDPLPAPLLLEMFGLVRSTVAAEGMAQPLYMPTFEQYASAQAQAGFLATHGVVVSSPERWVGQDLSYSEGWAMGRLVYVSAGEVKAAYADGRLQPGDILLVDAVPAEIPFVAGIITLTPTTPNSHVAILARSYGVPFGHFPVAADRERVASLVGREVIFQSCPIEQEQGCRLLVVPTDASLSTADRDALEALRTAPPLNLAAKERLGAYAVAVDDLTPGDIRFVGGKAANFGLLRRVIPSNAPPAIAFSFDLWDDFLDQVLVGELTLRGEMHRRLGHLRYPEDLALILSQLGVLRTLIREQSVFTAAQEEAILEALAGFDASRNIRFRSSTNVEDVESFTGAGLYDSYSGCVADDLDADTAGPSRCDGSEEDERGVFRAIRRVFASFYNDNAYLERRRLGVDEETVGMALLAHHSTPDDIELANGVATVTWNASAGVVSGHLVTQLGAVSVANPDGAALPEVVRFGTSPSGVASLQFLQASSLVRIGEEVMDWEADYRELGGLIHRVGAGYAVQFPGKERIDLDLEYKKVSPGLLRIKQVRELPRPGEEGSASFILNDPVALDSWHGFYDDLWMAHRIKSRWTLEHRSTFFAATNLEAGFYTFMRIEHLDGAAPATLEGPPASFLNASREVDPPPPGAPWLTRTLDRWTMNTLGGPADVELATGMSYTAYRNRPLTVLAREGHEALSLSVTFHEPQLAISLDGEVQYRTTTRSSLYLNRPENPAADVLLERTLRYGGLETGVVVHVRYWLPEEAAGDDCRCPLLRMVESRIEGLLTEPIVLHGYWSQTFNDIHRSNAEEFLFEPRLEEGLPAAQWQELETADIVQIYANANGKLFIVGTDGAPRQVVLD